MDTKIKEIAENYMEAVAEEGLELLRTLGKIPAPTRREEQRAAFVREWLTDNGASDVTIDKAKNVICKISCDEYEDWVVFAAHTDVVFEDLEPLPMKEDEEKLYAPGIGDDTSNLVNLLMAAKYILKNPMKPKCGIMIVANSCEEGNGNSDGIKELFAEYGDRIREFISFDGYMSQCTTIAVGSHRYRIRCKTRGGHSYLDYGEANAIEILCRMVEKLYQVQPPTEEKTTYNVGRIEGGSTVNSIAQSAEMLYEFRSTSQQCLKTMEKQFYEIVESCKAPDNEIQVEVTGIRPGNGPIDRKALQKFTDRSVDIIQTFYDGEMDYGAYSTDSNIPLSMGIIANTIGTMKGGHAHTREEWIEKKSLKDGGKIVLSLLLQYMDLK